MTLTEFLLARIAEDEEVAREDRFARPRHDRQGKRLPSRALAECEAKRRIVEEQHARAMIFLAQPYADRPDFDPDWAV